MYIDTYLEQKCEGSFKRLAMNWAPIVYQYISLDNNDYETMKDLLCPVNFGCYGRLNNPSPEETSTCWNTAIVRKRLETASKRFREAELKREDFRDLIPAAYYSVAVTDTHYFILYAFYHADDDTHPNDLEGCLLIIERNEHRPLLLGMITVAHLDFFPYIYKDRMEIKSHPPGQQDFEMEVEEELEGDHALLVQEKGKHGMYALREKIPSFLEKLKFWEICRKPDVIVYYPPNVIAYHPGEAANLYSRERLYKGKGTPHDPTFYYELIDILDDHDGLWNKYLNAQKSGGNLTFTEKGAFHTEGRLGRANGPWLWEPKQLIDTVEEGLMWKDPVVLVKQMFKPKGKEFNTNYHKKMMDRL